MAKKTEAKIIKFSKRSLNAIKRFPPQPKPKHTCLDCNRLYIADVMMCYKSPNYAYYEDKGSWYCIRCYNKRFQ